MRAEFEIPGRVAFQKPGVQQRPDEAANCSQAATLAGYGKTAHRKVLQICNQDAIIQLIWRYQAYPAELMEIPQIAAVCLKGIAAEPPLYCLPNQVLID